MRRENFKIGIFILFFFIGSSTIFSQQFANKNYYLIDSLFLDSLSDLDRNLVDSILPLYHKEKVDTLKLSYISKITEKCYDDNVWPKYNQLLFDEAQEQLTNPNLSRTEKKFIKKILASSVNNKGYLAYSLGDYKQAIELYEISFDLYQSILDKDGLATCLNNIGSIYDDRGNTEEALSYYLRSLEFVEQIGDREGIAIALNNIGYVYSDKGQIEKSLECYRKSIKILEEIGEKQFLATTYNNVGYIYKMQDDNEIALGYYNKSLKIFKEIGFEEGEAGSYNNIGQIYAVIDNAKALEFYQKSLEIQQKIRHRKGEAEASNNIGALFEKIGEYKEAYYYYSLSLEIRKEIGDVVGQAHSYSSIGHVRLLQGNLIDAKKYAREGFKISKRLGFPESIRDAALILSGIYKYENNPSKELEMYKLYVEMNDSISNEETKKVTIKHNIRYQFEKQALTDSLGRVESEKIKDLEHSQEIEAQKLYSFIGIVGFGLMFLVVMVVLRGYQLKRKSNLALEDKNKVIEEKNSEITDSITYAKRIQQAILPPSSELSTTLKECFVFYKPKDIVAGDFYWLQTVEDVVLYAAADCTGHGVPGAMVSVVCHNALNRAVREHGLIEPAAILDKTSELVIETFKSEGDDRDIKDGMDIALCSLNMKTKELQYAGANNSLYIISDGELTEIKPNKRSVGDSYRKENFKNHVLKLSENDCIYTFSDGYADQFGGPKGKKFMYKQFKKLLISIHSMSMSDQQERVKKEFNEWKGDTFQIDDVCVIGVRI